MWFLSWRKRSIPWWVGRKLETVWQGKSFISSSRKVHFVPLQIWKGQNETESCNSRKRNPFPYANLSNKRSHFASFSWILITCSFFSRSFPARPPAPLKSRTFYSGTFDRCGEFLASSAVYKHDRIKICFAKGEHYLWKEFMRKKAVFQELSAALPLAEGTLPGSPRFCALRGTLLTMCTASIFLTGTITHATQE